MVFSSPGSEICVVVKLCGGVSLGGETPQKCEDVQVWLANLRGKGPISCLRCETEEEVKLPGSGVKVG